MCIALASMYSKWDCGGGRLRGRIESVIEDELSKRLEKTVLVTRDKEKRSSQDLLENSEFLVLCKNKLIS